jgi:endonuclease YncB( thermonuclease family)
MLILSAVVVAGASFTCTPIAVWDGDGPIWCAEGPKVRLAGIAAREMDGSCSVNQPCPSASAIAARDVLVNFLGGAKGTMQTGHVKVAAAPMRCRSDGSAGGSRTAAWCTLANGRNLNCEMVRSQTALRWARYWRGHQC